VSSISPVHPLKGLRIGLLLALGLYGAFILRAVFRINGELHLSLIDDAMISMRYAQHLAAGQGLLWNIGETPVQGFSNLGWVVVMALLHVIAVKPSLISLGVMALSAGALLLNAVVAAQICREMSPRGRYAPLMAAGICAFYFPLVFWSLRGMEVGALVLLINTAAWLAIRKQPEGGRAVVILSVILGAALLLRLDALLQAAVIVTYAGLSGRLGRRRTLILVLVLALILAGILIFQQSYFGDALPNTYYQKLGGATIVERMKNGILAFYQHAARDTAMLAVVAVGGLWFYRRLRTREAALLASLFLIQCAYSIWIGGDYAEPEVDSANRFITQGMPALIVLFSLVADSVFSDMLAARKSARPSNIGAPWAISGAAIFGTILIISGAPWTDWAIDNAPLLKADIRRVRAGLAIAANTSSDATIAVHAAGQIPYYSERRTIDLLGLNDPAIAKGPRATAFYPGHDKWNYEYSIVEQQPDLIADNWIRLGDFMRGRSDYRQLENGMYMRVGTSLVDEAGLLGYRP
jgi:arabinofuranosyltransferase